MKTRNDFLNLLLNSLPDQIAVIDEHGMIVYVNQSWVSFGIKNGVPAYYDWVGTNYLAVCNDGEDDTGEHVCKTTAGIIDVVAGKKDSYQAEYPCDSPHQRSWFLMHITRLHGTLQKLFIISHTNITARKLAEDKARLLSMCDSLTGLANRRHLNVFLNLEWKRGLRSQRPLSVLLLDIDYFKQYNDAFGHIRGDSCLINISKIIKQHARRPSDLAARFGGEEFVLVLGETPLSDAEECANTLCEQIQALALPHMNNTVVTVSIGVSSVVPNLAIDEIYLLNQADSAVYLAKRNGRNRVETCIETCIDHADTVDLGKAPQANTHIIKPSTTRH